MLKKAYETIRNFASQTCKGLQKLIGYLPALPRESIIVVSYPEEGRVVFPARFAKNLSRIYSSDNPSKQPPLDQI